MKIPSPLRCWTSKGPPGHKGRQNPQWNSGTAMKPCATWNLAHPHWFRYALTKTGYIDCIFENQPTTQWSLNHPKKKKNLLVEMGIFPQMNFWVGTLWLWTGTVKRVLTKFHWIFYPETRKYARNACSYQYQVFQVFLYPGTIHDQTNCSILPFAQLRRHFEYPVALQTCNWRTSKKVTFFEAQMCI